VKPKATKFKTLKDAIDFLLFMDFNRVLEYRIVYNRASETDGEPEYWIIKRKILSYNAFGKAEWTVL
jgi:hypothetical protein